MISTSHTSACADFVRTARTSSMRAVPPESAFSNTPLASALCARGQNALESLKSDLRTQNEIADFCGAPSTRNCTQNLCTARTDGTRAVPPESTFSTTPSASALCARGQNVLKTLWSNLVASAPVPGMTLHSIGPNGGSAPTEFACGLLVFALAQEKSQKSVCLARRTEATARTDMRFYSCQT